MESPKHLAPPAYLSKSPPMPEAQPANGPITDDASPAGEAERLDPTRYGDWENKGIAVDF